MLKLIFVVKLLYVSAITASSLKMEVVYEWEPGEMDLAFPSQEFRSESIANQTFDPNYFVINGLAVHKHRVFITLPWELRNSATVTYLNLKGGKTSVHYFITKSTDGWVSDRWTICSNVGMVGMSAPTWLAQPNRDVYTSTRSPKLMPYPGWEAHLLDERRERRIGQVFRAHVDHCDRLWLLERVSENYLLRIKVMDLNSDKIIRTYTFPFDLDYSIFNKQHWIVVEDGDCEDTFAYINDYTLGGFRTYSWAKNDSWHIDGYKNINAMILAPNSDDAFSTIYYQVNSSTNFPEIFFVSTKHLRDEQTALSTVHLSYQISEAINLRAAIFDPATNVLYSSDHQFHKKLRLIPCWNKKNECPVSGISELMINVDSNTEFEDVMTVDGQGNLWIEARRGPKTALLKFSPPFDICTGV